MVKAKSFDISRDLLYKAYKAVKSNRGVAGVDRESIEEFELNLEGNLYKIWNRMSSGSYLPPPVMFVEIPKADGGKRTLGIPTVGDRIAQTAVKMVLEPLVEPHFHESSYGYRPRKSAIQAVGKARERCWSKNWVIDVDIKGFFDNLDHSLIELALARHTDLKWIHLNIGRWLRAPMQRADGTLVERVKGTPQGGVISPLLANLFMHYAFDLWMAKNHPGVEFERYADDFIVHCVSKEDAVSLLSAIKSRFEQCKLELHPLKTKIVYCKDDDRRGEEEVQTFDFLGYTFGPRRAKSKHGKLFVSFLPAMSRKSAVKVRRKINEWKLPKKWSNRSLAEIAKMANPVLRGWLNYYAVYSKSKCYQVLQHFNYKLAVWAGEKYKGLHKRLTEARHFLSGIAKANKKLFVLWERGVAPSGWNMGAV